MIAVDSNVLLRMLADDDPRQSRLAAAAVARAELSGEEVFVNHVVLAETMWTMARRYKAPRSQLRDLARGLLETPVFAFERRASFEEAVRLFESSNADFSDCMIVARNNAAGCAATLTFDANCAKLPGTRALQ